MQPPVTIGGRRRALPSPGVLRGLIALVWLYQGLWLKLLLASKDQTAVVEAVTGLTGPAAGAALAAIGVVEAGLALWVLSGCRPVATAAVQTALLVAMNGAGIIFARQAIPDPAGMVIGNLIFLGLAWCAAVSRVDEDGP